jgi:hypothetical protein
MPETGARFAGLPFFDCHTGFLLDGGYETHAACFFKKVTGCS